MYVYIYMYVLMYGYVFIARNPVFLSQHLMKNQTIDVHVGETSLSAGDRAW